MANKPLAKLKTEIAFNQDLTRLVDVMKGIAAAQYHMMERKKTDMSAYEELVNEMYQVYDFRRVQHPYLRSSGDRKLIILLTTDGGFLGGLNVKVIQGGMQHGDNRTHYLVIGERGANYLKEFNIPHTALPGVNADDSRYELLETVIQHINRFVVKEGYSQVLLAYPFAVSFTAQRVEVLNLIPCPYFFKDKPKEVPKQEDMDRDIILESNPSRIVEYMTHLWMRYRVLSCFEHGKLSEFGARTMHLEDSYQTLDKIEKQLKLEFFKARREKIDQSLRESFASQLLCK